MSFNAEGLCAADGALLSGAKPECFPHADCADRGAKMPKFEGGFDKFMEAHPEVAPQMFNQIKKCPKCGKPCAKAMKSCNNCLADLTSVEVSQTPNVFMCFMFGIDFGAFPFKISLRSESSSMLVIDDPLAITRMHLLAMPADIYIPDIRSLFVAPVLGLQILIKMEDAAWAAMSTEHLGNETFKRKALSPAACEMDVQDLRGHVMKAFNLPPSQYQLHLQYMLPPMLPFHVAIFQKKMHYIKGRHFPFKYVKEALEAFAAAGANLPEATEMATEDFVAEIAKLGVDYDKAHEEDLAKFAASNELLGNYSAEDFKYAAKDGELRMLDGTALPADAPSAKDAEVVDKLALQSYGRPYTEAGKPGGVYFSHARDVALLPTLS